MADCSEKSAFFSHSRLQSSYSLVQLQKDLTIDLGFKVVEGLNEIVEEKKKLADYQLRAAMDRWWLSRQ